VRRSNRCSSYYQYYFQRRGFTIDYNDRVRAQWDSRIIEWWYALITPNVMLSRIEDLEIENKHLTDIISDLHKELVNVKKSKSE
jgi:hypothetical protein